MRLKEIHLAGFKSFVEPTRVPFPSDLVAILGPNGCGKSNIIDAVRWVMGESSAKNLRGESMADVIFNGSSQRKPVGQASIELVFDNSSGRLQGQYGQYAEISVRRVVNRDGESQYFLNGSRCRRRDISDLLSGTGLGPRSYAIIEQGTISRLVESRPHELRLFLEEAAGIAKYKERRRETQLRMEHTEENLSRLNDLRQELTSRLELLSGQAETARQFKLLREQERHQRNRLDSFRWHQLEQRRLALEPAIEQQVWALEQARLQSDQQELHWAVLRLQQSAAKETLEQTQSQYYALAAQIAREEQSLTGWQQSRQRLLQEQQQNQNQRQIVAEKYQHDQQQYQQLQQRQQQLEPELALLVEDDALARWQLEQGQAQFNEWQQGWQQQQQQLEQAKARHQLLLAQSEQLQRQVRRAESELLLVQQELGSIQAQDWSQQQQALQPELDLCRMALAEAEQQLQDWEQRQNQQQQQQEQQRQQLADLERQYAGLQGRLASLESMQQASLNPVQSLLEPWLQAQGLADSPLLASQIRVPELWMPVVELLLGQRLQTRLVPVLPTADWPAAAFSLLQTDGVAAPVASQVPWLVDLIESPVSLWPWLMAIKAVATADEALVLQSQLSTGESVVTLDGLWLGPNWQQGLQAASAAPGVLVREHEIQHNRQQLAALELQLQPCRERCLDGQQQLQRLSQQRPLLLQHQQQLNHRLQQLSSDLAVLEQASQQQQQRLCELNRRYTDALATQHELREEQALYLLQADEAHQLWQQCQQQTMQHQAWGQNQQQQQQLQQQQLRDSQTALQAGRLEQVRLDSQIQAVQQALERLQQQQQQVVEQNEHLAWELHQTEAPLAAIRLSLDDFLAQQLAAEQELQHQRQQLAESEQALHELDTQRQQRELDRQKLNQKLEQLRLELAACQLKQEHVLQQLQQADFVLLAATEVGALVESAVNQELQQLQRQISQLGDINLTAIDEYEQQKQRKDYLDLQYQDLTDALATLAEAIRKIDRETRHKFQQTFDQVNSGLQELFPKVFGGGQAWLELTEADLLETGVTIMARPPGKRNSRIHLLSGGEKALTAMSLVFAIFELNPAPFCMLDEVDAPLDDVNVGRFCQLVNSMVDRVQFIYITHNKVAMEMASHLIGVTMQEPGVSRLVSVDIEQAISLAAS